MNIKDNVLIKTGFDLELISYEFNMPMEKLQK